MVIEFDLPVYFIQVFKTKPSKTHFVGMNWYRSAHFSMQNKVKHHYHDLIKTLIADKAPLEPLMSYQVSYTYYYKNIVSDLSNACSIASKFANDSFQQLGFVVDDNVQHLQSEHFYVGGRDTLNPRITVRLEKYTK